MAPDPSAERDELLLVHAPIGRDARLLHEIFQRAGLLSSVCTTAEDLCREMELGAGAAIVAEEALDRASIQALTQILEKQEYWSDLPLLVLTVRGEQPVVSRQRLAALATLANLTLLERPLRSDTIVSAARSALRARAKQRQVSQRDAALREAKVRLQAVIDQMPAGLFIVEAPTGKIVAHNAEAERILGHPAIPAENHQEYSAYGAVHDDGTPYPAEEYPTARALLRGEVVRQQEMRYRRGDGELICLSVNAAPIKDGEETVAAVSNFQDITAQKHAAAERERLVEELARSNEELARFAHVAAHDLQSPLRMVKSYTQLLERRLADRLDDSTRNLMAMVLDGASRMDKLVQALLHYAQVGQNAPDCRPVSMEAVVSGSIANLELLIRDHHARVSHGPLPTVQGDEAHLLQMMQNLIANAIKYRREGVPPEVRISARKLDGRWEFAVNDNGQGIAPQYREQVFEPLKRLHGNDVPGTGIGLAVCKRVVERHGGRIWVESHVGVGSTFYFTLSAKAR